MADTPKRRGLVVGDRIDLREPVLFGAVSRQRFVVFSVRARHPRGVTMRSCIKQGVRK
jgi:hypothetical protein